MSTSSVRVDVPAAAGTDADPMTRIKPPVVWTPEPGACGGRLDPNQELVPDELASMLDWHVWPSASPWAMSPKARTVCGHVDYELLWHNHPEWFTRHVQVGVPPPETLWDAKHALLDLGHELILDVQLEEIEGELSLAVYGAGVVGRMRQKAWQAAAGLLTTCCSMIREPRRDVDIELGAVPRPARTPLPNGQWPMPTAVRPELWQRGDWLHTWWAYPFFGTLREGCPCPAHTDAARAVTFGGTRTHT